MAISSSIELNGCKKLKLQKNLHAVGKNDDSFLYFENQCGVFPKEEVVLTSRG